MDVAKILSELRMAREQIIEAIRSLERLSYLRHNRRGRPPKLIADIESKERPNSVRQRASATGTGSEGRK